MVRNSSSKTAVAAAAAAACDNGRRTGEELATATNHGEDHLRERKKKDAMFVNNPSFLLKVWYLSFSLFVVILCFFVTTGIGSRRTSAVD